LLFCDVLLPDFLSFSIGWAHGKDRTVRLDDYESTRPPRRQQLDLVLTRQDREDILLEWGASFSEIIEAIRSNIKAKNQRRNTVNTIGRYDRWEEMMEKAGRKLKRTILLKKSSSSKNKVEAYMYALQQQQGGGSGGSCSNGQHHHLVTDDDDVTVYTTMPMHDQHHHRHHHRPPPEIVSHHHSAGSSTGNNSLSCATPDTIPAANPVDHLVEQTPTSSSDENVRGCRKTWCLEANAQVPKRRTSDRSGLHSVDIKDLITEDDDDDEHDDTKDNNKSDNDNGTNNVPVKLNVGSNTGDTETDKETTGVCTKSCCLAAALDGDNVVDNTCITQQGGAVQQAGQQQKLQLQQEQQRHFLSRQELEELIVDPNVPLVEVDLLSQPSLPSYYSFSDDVSQYYMTRPGNVDDDDDDGIDEDNDDDNPMMTMNDWHILQTIQSGYVLGQNHIRDGAAGASANNYSSGSSSSDVDRGFTSLHRDTSHWEVGGNGLDAPRICRRFVPTIISEDESVMPQDISSSPTRIDSMHLMSGAANNDGPPVFHRGGTGGPIHGAPAIFHYATGRGVINDGPPPTFRHGDGPLIFHHPVASSSSPALLLHHPHHMMVDGPRPQQQAASSQPHQYLNQGFVMAPPPPPPPHTPCQYSQYIARWE
jgi:hypothetical protein